jgi:hypothetical protein
LQRSRVIKASNSWIIDIRPGLNRVVDKPGSMERPLLCEAAL